eukprot:2910962-Rhodomonas_salina.4
MESVLPLMDTLLPFLAAVLPLMEVVLPWMDTLLPFVGAVLPLMDEVLPLMDAWLSFMEAVLPYIGAVLTGERGQRTRAPSRTQDARWWSRICESHNACAAKSDAKIRKRSVQIWKSTARNRKILHAERKSITGKSIPGTSCADAVVA